MEAAISGLIARSTASGWVLCILALGGIIQLGRLIVLQRPKMRELEMTEGESLRSAFVGEMAALREEVAGLRVENNGLREEIREMRGENTMLRKEVRSLHATIDGMRREAMQVGVSTQRAVVEALPEGFVPAATQEALNRMKGVGE